MARQRMLHPDFFTDSKVVRCTPLARLLFQGLWCLADREGRLEADALALKLRVLPVDNCDVPSLLEELTKFGLITPYEVDGLGLIHIRGFTKRQRPHPKEPASSLPAPIKSITLPAAEKHGEPRKILASPSESESESESESVKDLSSEHPIQAIWNAARKPPLPEWTATKGKRLTHANARLADHPEPEFWRGVMARIDRSDFLSGRKNDFRATPDWIINPSNLTKILEGNYDGTGPPRASKGPVEPSTQTSFANGDVSL